MIESGNDDAFFALSSEEKRHFLKERLAALRAPSFDSFPLTALQQAYFVGRETSDEGASLFIEFEAEIPAECMITAWRRLVDRHPMLRVRIGKDGTQRVEAGEPIPTSAVRSNRADAEGGCPANGVALERHIFRAGDFPLWRVEVKAETDERSVVRLVVDMWILDGTSLFVLLDEWGRLARNQSLEPAPAITFPEFEKIRQARSSAEEREAAKVYWQRETRDVATSPVTFKAPENLERERLTFTLPAVEWGALQRAAAAVDVSPSACVLGLFVSCLQWEEGSPDAGFILTVSNRSPLHADADRIVGPLSSTAVFRCSPTSTGTLTEALREVQGRLRAMQDHQAFGGVEVLRTLGSRAESLTRIVFTSMLGQGTESELSGSIRAARTSTPGVFLDCQAQEREGALWINWDVLPDAFPEDLLDRCWKDFCGRLRRISAMPEVWLHAPVHSLPRESEWNALPLWKSDEANKSAPFPSAPVQRAYLAAAASGEHSIFFQELAVRSLDSEGFRTRLETCIRHFPSLRVVFDGRGYQRILPDLEEAPLEFFDLREVPTDVAEAQMAALRERLHEGCGNPFEAPLFRIAVVRRNEEESRVLVAVNFLIGGGSSLAEILATLFSNDLIPASAPAFRDYILSLENGVSTHERTALEAYWADRLRDLSPAPFETRPGATADWRRVERSFINGKALRDRARQAGVRPGSILLAAFVGHLRDWSAREAFTLGVVLWDRLPMHPEVNRIDGDFTQISWLPVEGSEQSTLDLSKRIDAQLREDLKHAAVSPLAIMGKRAASGENAAFPVVFTDFMTPKARALPADVEVVESHACTPGVTLDHVAYFDGDTLRVHWDYRADVFEAEEITAQFERYGQSLEVFLSGGKPACTAVGVIAAAGQAVPEAWNDTACPFPEDQPMHAFFEEQANRNPDAVALTTPDDSWTYQELQRASDAVARALLERGLPENRLIGVCLDRRSEMVAVLYGILKTGCAFVPLETTYPDARLAQIVESAELEWVVAEDCQMKRSIFGSLNSATPEALIATGKALAGPLPPVDSTSRAYVIYTSGSTGQPKGVVVAHRAVANLIDWARKTFDFGPGDRGLFVVALSFDLSIFDLFGMLACGASVRLATLEERMDLGKQVEILAKEPITFWNSAPASLQLLLPLLEECPERLKETPLRLVFQSGDWIPLDLPGRVHALFSQAETVGLGGATEATVWSNVHRFVQVDPSWKSIPYGRPFQNCRYYILDESGKPVPVGEEGDLCIAGACLADGYLNQPELTAEAFVPDPFVGESGARMYRTGDRARFWADGTIEFLGRRDSQVKVRGFRIELGEIESLLRQDPSVAEAVAAVQRDRKGDAKLVAYVVLERGTVDAEALRASLQARLPAYMVPNHFAGIAALPVSPNGKLDRSRLPWPLVNEKADQAMAENQCPSSAPQADSVVQVIREVLEQPELSLDGNLFDHGATSFTIILLTQRLKRDFGIGVPVNVFFDTPTARAVAAHVVRESKETVDQVPEEIQQDYPAEDARINFRSEEDRAAFKKEKHYLRALTENATTVDCSAHAVTWAERNYRTRATYRRYRRESIERHAFEGFLGLLGAQEVDGVLHRLYASAGSTYPVQTYVYLKPEAVEGIDAGLYYFHPDRNALVLIDREPDIDARIVFLTNRPIFEKAAFALFFVMEKAAIEPLYGEGAVPFSLLEAGYMSQLLMSRQTEFGLGLCAIGGMEFEKIRPVFKLRQSQQFLTGMVGGRLTVADEKKLREPEAPDIATASNGETALAAKAHACEPIAIVGMAGRYPQADDLDAFWRNLEAGRDCVREVPAERWQADAFFDPSGEGGKAYCKVGGFMDAVDAFDPLFFEITPQEAAFMDPQERQFLEVSWACLEDAGWTRQRIREELAGSVGVFAGVMYGEYQLYSRLGETPPMGNCFGSIANRVSYVLDLNGPSLAVDTLCSSSLTSIHLACESLRRGECRAAIAGGVCLILHPNRLLMESQARMSSKEGRCAAFGVDADGFVPGEGVGALFLKPLSAAKRDGDRIHGLIRGTAVAHGGKASAYTAPTATAQAEVVRRALQVAGLNASNISCIEAHGTGTALGDPIELAGLEAVFGQGESRCALGSVKSNLGHLEGAAGIAGLTKILLQMYHRKLAPTLHVANENPHLDFGCSAFRLTKEIEDWTPALGELRRAGVSAFGAGGANAHVVLEEYIDTVPSHSEYEPMARCFPLSARDEEQLKQHTADLLKFLEGSESVDLTRLAWTLQVGRESWECRACLCANSREELISGLRALVQNGSTGGSQAFSEASEAFLQGESVNWRGCWGASVTPLSLPHYPFRKERYWLPAKDALSHPYLGHSAQAGLGVVARTVTVRMTPVSETEEASADVCWRKGDADWPMLANVSALESHFTQNKTAIELDVSTARDEDSAECIEAAIAVLSAAKRLNQTCHLRLRTNRGQTGLIEAFLGLRAAMAIEWKQAEVEIVTIDPQNRVYAVSYDLDESWKSVVEESKGPGVALITGGTGGIGRLLALSLVDSGTRIALCGRSPRTDAVEKLLAEVERSGGQAVYFKADVATEEGARAAVELTRRYFGPVEAVYHTAGVLADAAIEGKTAAMLTRELSPKVEAARYLHRALADEESLKSFIFFGSATAVLGSSGQGGYVAANGFLQGFARWREMERTAGRAFGLTRTVAWPLWADGGMRVSPAHREELTAHGLLPLPSSEALRYLRRISIESAPVVSLCLYGEEARIESVFEVPADEEVVPNEPVVKYRELLIVVLKETVASVTGLPVERIDERRTYDSYGIESLAINRINEDLERKFGVLPKTLLFEYPTLGQLADYLLREQGAGNASSLAGGSAKPSEAPSGYAAREHRVSAVSITGHAAPPVNKDNTGPIAVIGLAGTYPQSENLEAFWENLASGRDCLSEVPASRWNVDRLFDADPERVKDGKVYARRGGFLDDVDRFDARFFRMAPREAECVDPQERLFLQIAWQAFEDAGVVPSLPGNGGDSLAAGVFVGVTTLTYGLWAPEMWRAGRSLWPSMSPWSLANRVSYLFNLSGPSMPVDTACSASLTAVHLACESLRRGECEVALAGGVNLYLHPARFAQMCQLRMLAPDGESRPFGAGSAGIVPGEGVGAVILKPLCRALEDGDPIRGVLLGSALNHGGHTHGYTVPNPQAQASLVRRALEQAGVDPSSLDYIEAHGTGTELGDPVELSGLNQVFRDFGRRGRPCALGSVKSNIGHLESAAGMAGLTKVLLQLEKRSFVPSINAEILNPKLSLGDGFFEIQRSAAPWPASDGRPRRAGVSSFGAGGANAHVVIEEAPEVEPSRGSEGPWLFVFSAADADGLRRRVSDLLRHIDERICAETSTGRVDTVRKKIAEVLELPLRAVGADTTLEELGFDSYSRHRLATALDLEPTDLPVDPIPRALAGLLNGAAESCEESAGSRQWLEQAAWTLQSGRAAMGERLAVAVDSLQTLRESLEQFYAGKVPPNIVVGKAFESDAVVGISQIRPATLGELVEVGERWVAGAAVDWRVWQGNMPVRRIALPGYRFEGKRYWFTDESVASALETLGDCVRKGRATTKPTIRFAADAAVVRDHRMEGRKLLAGAAMLARLSAAASGGRILQGVAVSRPVFVDEEDCVLSLQLAAGGDFQLLNEKGETCLAGSFGAPARWEQAKLRPPASGADSVAVEDLYAICAKGGLDYGDTFRVLRRIQVNGYHLSAELSAATDLDPVDRETVLVDGAFQSLAAFFLSDSEGGAAWVPFALQAYAISADLPASISVRAELKRRTSDQATFDIDLLGCDEDLVGRLRGFVMRRLRPAKMEPEMDSVRMISKMVPVASVSSTTNAFYPDEIVTLEPDNTHGPLRAFGCVLNPVQAALAQGRSRNIGLVVPRERQLSHALDALARSLALETHIVRLTILEVPAKEIGNDTLIREGFTLAREHRASALYWRERQWNRCVMEESVVAETGRPEWAVADPVIVVAGGTGGLGRALVAHLLSVFPEAKFAVIGRRSRIDATIDRGLPLDHVMLLGADLSDAAQTEAAIASVKKQWGRIDGAFHLCGRLADSRIENITTAESDPVIASKVTAARNLDVALAGEPLQHFVCFGSLAGEFGNAGQASYAFANGALTDFVEARNEGVRKGRRQGCSRLIAWPLWDSDGMQAPAASRAWAESTAGLVAMPLATGFRVMDEILASDASHVVVVYGHGERLRKSFLSHGWAKSSVDGATQSSYSIDPMGALLRVLREGVSSVLKLDDADIENDLRLSNFGFDSISFTELSSHLNRTLNLATTPALFFDANSLDDVATRLMEDYGAHLTAHLESGERLVGPQERARDEKAPLIADASAITTDSGHSHSNVSNDSIPIAIVGMAGRFPGSRDIAEFWIQLLAGKDLTSEVPLKRWDWRELYGDPHEEPGKTTIKRAGFMPEIDCFDADFFGISPFEAELMDPQHRLFLKTVWEAVESAGHDPHSIGTRVALFAGVASLDYSRRVQEAGLGGEPHALLGVSHSVLVNRISHWFDWQGPSEPVDTACSSSLVAVHRAVQCLRRGEVDWAVAGGVSALLDPNTFSAFEKTGVLAPDGATRTFDAEASGYARGEGVGAVCLRRFDDAVEDGDPILAVIRGTAVNHGGRNQSLTTPNSRRQAEVIERAHREAGFSAEQIHYIETHGTGTRLGDPVEIEGIRLALKHLESENATNVPHVVLGAVKAQTGHLETAAGICGLIKTIEVLRHRQSPGIHHFKTLNPYLRTEDGPLCISGKVTSLDAESPILRGGVSSFGFGGVNCHIALESAPVAAGGPAVSDARIVVISGRSEEHLRAQCGRLAAWFEDCSDAAEFASACWTLQVGRTAFRWRFACVAENASSASVTLRKLEAGQLIPQEVGRGANGVTELLGDEAMTGMVRQWIDHNALDRLAAFWQFGGTVDWSLLYRERPRRISLPTTVFREHSFWLDGVKEAGRVPVSAERDEILYFEEVWRSSDRPLAHPRSLFKPHWLIAGSARDGGGIRLNGTLRWPDPGGLSEKGVRDTIGQLDWSKGGCVSFHGLDARWWLPVALEICACLARDEATSELLVWWVLPVGHDAEADAVSALGRSHTQESPAHRIRVLRAEENEAPRVFSLMNEGGSGNFRDLRVIDEKLDERLVEAREETVRADGISFDADGCVVVSGGLGELGRRLVDWLLRDHRVAVMILGRSKPTDESEIVLNEWLHEDLPVQCVQVDVTERPALESALTQARERFGAIHGVFHLARAVENGLLVDKSAESLEMNAAKFSGTCLLDELTAGDPLAFFITYSSVASIWGLAGAADYAAACAFQNGFVRERELAVNGGQRHGRSLSICWPQWRYDRYASDQAVDPKDVVRLPWSVGVKILEHAMAGHISVPIYLYGQKQRILEALERANTVPANTDGTSLESCISDLQDHELDALLAEFDGATCAAVAGSEDDKPVSDWGKPQESAAVTAQTVDTRGTVVEVFAELLRLDPDTVDCERPWREHGLDSVLGAQFLLRVRKRTGVRCPQRWLREEPNLNTLVARIETAIERGEAEV